MSQACTLPETAMVYFVNAVKFSSGKERHTKRSTNILITACEK
jgi:hypothetical protein